MKKITSMRIFLVAFIFATSMVTYADANDFDFVPEGERRGFGAQTTCGKCNFGEKVCVQRGYFFWFKVSESKPFTVSCSDW